MKTKEQQAIEKILIKHDMQHLLDRLNPKKKNEDEDEEIPSVVEFLSQFEPERIDPDGRGIIFINVEISKNTLARVTEKLVSLHFDKSFTDDIQLIINSPGGYADAGWAFIDLMGWVSNKIKTIAIGQICSMATNIFIAGDERIMAPNSEAMIHPFSGSSGGSYPELIASRKAEDMEYQRELNHLLQCSKYTKEEDIRKYLLRDQDNWLSPQEMKQHGLCDAISAPRKTSKKGVEKRMAQTKKDKKAGERVK